MTPWEILGIAQDADKRDIKRAYGKLIKENRPDDSPEQFQRIRSAYEPILETLADTSAQSQPVSYIVTARAPTTVPTTAPITVPTTVSTADSTTPSAEGLEPTQPTKDTPTKKNRSTTSDSKKAPQNTASKQTASNDSSDDENDTNRAIAVEANAFIGSFNELLAKFPDNGKLTTRDLELCRLETVTLMRSNVLNHWHAREYLADRVFSLLCENIAISTGLWSTTTNFPAQFLQYLDEQFLWTENEVTLCELCEDDSAGLVFHVIHDGRNSNLPNWSELPEPSNDSTSSEHNSGIHGPGKHGSGKHGSGKHGTGKSLGQNIIAFFSRKK